MVNAIVGYTGFVGLNLQQFYKLDYFYNSKNFEEARNKEFDTIFFCGIPAVKWYANKYPDEDYNIIKKIKLILNTIQAKKFILISTIDVYDIVDIQLDEDYEIKYTNNHVYGKNRFLFEEFIKNRYENYNIIRLPALFGKGLKKNIIYDLINNNNINDIPINSSFQWYYLDWLKKDIEIVLKNDIKICNFFTEPIHTKEILKIFKDSYSIDYPLENFGEEKIMRKYNTCTKYNHHFHKDKKYVREEVEIIESIREYLHFEKLDKSKLCVSNICINQISQYQFASILKLYGIKNVQIAPTKIIDLWDNLNDIDFKVFTDQNLNIQAFQSITYTLNSLNIFDYNTQEKLYQHLIKVIDCAEKNKVDVLVFGCPRNRTVLDKNKDNNLTFINFFKRIGDYLKDKNVVICLENNSKKYNCNFINNIKESAYLVRQIDKDNVKMMIDLGNAVMENDHWYYLKDYIDILYNIDVAQPNMIDFSEPHESNKIFNYVLKNKKYNRVINLEMLIKDENNELELLCKSIHNFIKIYSN